MADRRSDELGGLADALQRLVRAQQGASTEFARVAEQIGGVGKEVATLMAEAAAQVAVPRDATGRADPQDVLRRVQGHLSQASDLFRRASDLFAHANAHEKTRETGSKGQEPGPRGDPDAGPGEPDGSAR